MTYEYDLHQSKEEGRAEGLVEGKAEGKWEIVDAMLANGIPVEKIETISGFSKEDILKRSAASAK